MGKVLVVAGSEEMSITCVMRERAEAIMQGAPWSVHDAEYELVVTVHDQFNAYYYSFSWPFSKLSDLPMALEEMAKYLRNNVAEMKLK